MAVYCCVWFQHTLPICWLGFEKLFVPIHYPSRKRGLLCVLTFALLYQCWQVVESSLSQQGMLLFVYISIKVWIYFALTSLNRPLNQSALWLYVLGLLSLTCLTTCVPVLSRFVMLAVREFCCAVLQDSVHSGFDRALGLPRAARSLVDESLPLFCRHVDSFLQCIFLGRISVQP